MASGVQLGSSDKVISVEKSEVTTFARKASGLARQWSPLDLFIRLVGSGNPFGPWMLFGMLIAPYVFPYSNATVAIVMSAMCWAVVAVVYGMFVSSMPRSGGDYIWMSRTLHPAGAYGLCWFQIIIFGAWTYFNTTAAASIGVLPLASFFGLKGVVAWITSFQGVFLWASFWIIAAYLVVVAGMKVVAWYQRIVFPLLLIALAVYVITAFWFGHDAFVATFNSQFNSAFNTSNAYQFVIDQAPTPKTWHLDLWQCFLVVPVLPVGIAVAYGGPQIIGEVKGIGRLRTALWTFVGTSFAQAIEAGLATAAFFYLAGPVFISAIGYQFAEGTALGAQMSQSMFVTYINMLMVKQPILVLLIGLGPIFANMMYYPYPYLMISRYLFGMSFDRLLPTKIVEVERRTRSPIYAVTFVLILNLLWAFIISYYSEYTVWYLGSASIGYQFLPLGVVIAGLFFAYRARTKSIWEVSPASKYKLGGVPWITICSAISVVFLVYSIWGTWTFPFYGGSDPRSLLSYLAVFIIAVIAFYYAAWYRKTKQGIPISLAFTQVPPE